MSTDIDLLAFGPHPDDVELSCGGLLAQYGARAAIVDLTRGELATNGSPELRAKEAAAAAEALGVPTRENLGLPDGGLRGDDPDQIAAVVGALRRLQPTIALAPWVEARHPDHAATARLVEQAMFFAGVRKYRPDLGPPSRPTRLVFYAQRIEFAPSFVVGTSAVQAQKAAAIACHVSQFGRRDTDEGTLINAPLGLQAFEVRDRYWGATIGVSHGEPYRIRGPVPLTDPVAALGAAGPVLSIGTTR